MNDNFELDDSEEIYEFLGEFDAEETADRFLIDFQDEIDEIAQNIENLRQEVAEMGSRNSLIRKFGTLISVTGFAGIIYFGTLLSEFSDFLHEARILSDEFNKARIVLPVEHLNVSPSHANYLSSLVGEILIDISIAEEKKILDNQEATALWERFNRLPEQLSMAAGDNPSTEIVEDYTGLVDYDYINDGLESLSEEHIKIIEEFEGEIFNSIAATLMSVAVMFLAGGVALFYGKGSNFTSEKKKNKDAEEKLKRRPEDGEFGELEHEFDLDDIVSLDELLKGHDRMEG